MSGAGEISTVYLGEFTWEHANTIAGELEKADIVWWYKQPGFLSQIWEHGTRLFVDRARLEEARAIVARVLGSDHSEGEGSSSGQT